MTDEEIIDKCAKEYASMNLELTHKIGGVDLKSEELDILIEIANERDMSLDRLLNEILFRYIAMKKMEEIKTEGDRAAALVSSSLTDRLVAKHMEKIDDKET